MKIVLSSTALSDAVKMLSQALNRKNALPILGDFHFDVNGKEVTITASDSEVTLQQTIGLAESEVDGKFCVSATQLRDALVGISEQPITLDADVENNSFKVVHSTGETYFAITSPIADEYPMPAQQKYKHELTMQSTDLIDAINRCLWATAKDDNRPNLGGVYFDIDGDSLTVVASDGSCIVKTEIFTGADAGKGGFLLPKKAAMILAKQPKSTDLHISYNNTKVLIESERIKMYATQVDAKYPDYNKVIPEAQNCTYQAKLNRINLMNIAHKIEPFTIQSATTSRIALVFGAGDNPQLEVRGEDYDMSMGAFDTMHIEEAEGGISEPLAIGVNAIRLAQVLKCFNEMYVTIHTFGDTKPVVIKESDPGEEAPEITTLIMPVLLND